MRIIFNKALNKWNYLKFNSFTYFQSEWNKTFKQLSESVSDFKIIFFGSFCTLTFVPMSLKKIPVSFLHHSAVALGIRSNWREMRMPKTGLTIEDFTFLQDIRSPNCHYFECSLIFSYIFNFFSTCPIVISRNHNPKTSSLLLPKEVLSVDVFKPLLFIKFWCWEFQGPDSMPQDESPTFGY